MLLSAGAAVGAGTARDAAVPLRIPLDPLGYHTITPEFLLAGQSALTVDFVDNDHLLITFGVRRLMKREADTQPGDDDRMIGAFLVEVPSGKVLARTEWRVHDRLQYLWSLGHGRFLLRIRDRLYVIAPLASADPNNAFHELPVTRGDRHIVAILVSSNDDLLTLYTVKGATATGDTGEVVFGDAQADPAPVQISFFRLNSASDAEDGLRLISAGTLRSREAASLPMTTGGFLDVLNGGRGTWLFNFDEHAGKVNELLAFETSCFPHSTFVNHSEFVVLGCRGSDDRQDLAAFNLKGDEMWLQNFGDTHVSPTFSFAPAAGRFALGRTIVNVAVSDDSPLAAGMVSGQEVRVYQSYNGKQLFRIDLTPVERAGQNFALSPDGMRLAVVRETQVRHAATEDTEAYTAREAGVEIYDLPPLTKDDRAAMNKEEALAPPDTGARIDAALERATASDAGSISGPASAASTSASDPAATNPVAMTPDGGHQKSPAATAAGDAPTGGSAGADPNSGAATEGDPVPMAPRKPPTLYAPGEKPQDKDKASPQ